MLGEGSASVDRLGIELFVGGEVVEEEYAPANGRHRVPGRDRRVTRVTQFGQDMLTSSARLVGRQVGTVIRETLTGMDRAALGEATTAGLRVSSVELSFGVKLTGGAGKALEAVVTAGGEASIQVIVTLDRPG
ncbi:MAG: CU044_2847 family protein [Pseudonocardiaceae bacterium]